MLRDHRHLSLLGVVIAVIMLVAFASTFSLIMAQGTPTPTPNINWVNAPLGVFVRSGPGLSYDTIGQLPVGAWVQPLARDENGEWILIGYLTTEGWITISGVSWRQNIATLPVIDDPDPTPIPPLLNYNTPGGPTQTPNANWVDVGVEGAFVRSGPGQGYISLGVVYTGDVVDPVAHDEAFDWVMIRFGDGYGWLRYDLVRWMEDIEPLTVVDLPNLTPDFTDVPVIPTDTSTPTTTHTPTPTATFTPTDTPTATDTPTDTATPTAIPTETSTATPTETLTSTTTPTHAPTDTPIPTDTPSPTNTVTHTPSSTLIPPTDTATVTTMPTDTVTATPTLTETAAPTATWTSVPPTDTATPEPAQVVVVPSATPTEPATATPVPSATPTLMPTATDTPIPPTDTATVTLTPTVVPSETPTATPSATPSETPTPEPTATDTLTATTVRSETPTSEPTATDTATATDAPTETPSVTPSETLIPPTDTATVTHTPTEAPSATPSATSSETPTRTIIPTLTFTATVTFTPIPLAIAGAETGDDGTTDEIGEGSNAPASEPDTDDPSGISMLAAVLVGGLFVLTMLYVAWYAVNAANLDRYREGFVLKTCPVCEDGELYLEERGYRLLGIPRVRRVVRCDNCRSVLRQVGSRRWRYAVDNLENSELYEAFNNKMLTEDELIDILGTPPQYYEGDDLP